MVCPISFEEPFLFMLYVVRCFRSTRYEQFSHARRTPDEFVFPGKAFRAAGNAGGLPVVPICLLPVQGLHRRRSAGTGTIASRSPTGGNVIDVGANIGYTATVLAQSLDPAYCVYAFEPEPFNFLMLQQTTPQAGLNDKIIALQCAVGAEDGTIELCQNLRHHADHRVITDQFRSAVSGVTGISVPMVSIDRFLERNPGPVSFVKIDVQVFELVVCQGMTTTLERNSLLTVVLECAPSGMRELGFDPSELVGFLVDRGFQAYLVCQKGVLSPRIPSGLEDSGCVDLCFSRRPMACGEAA
jgi:FkbM family methyltransferase